MLVGCGRQSRQPDDGGRKHPCALEMIQRFPPWWFSLPGPLRPPLLSTQAHRPGSSPWERPATSAWAPAEGAPRRRYGGRATLGGPGFLCKSVTFPSGGTNLPDGGTLEPVSSHRLGGGGGGQPPAWCHHTRWGTLPPVGRGPPAPPHSACLGPAPVPGWYLSTSPASTSVGIPRPSPAATFR